MTQPYRTTDATQEQPPMAPGTTLPPHLPVPWTDPEEAGHFYERDLMHFPDPVTTLDFTFVRHCVDHGMAMTVPRFASPVRSVTSRFWTHVYTRDVLYCEPQDVRKVWNSTMRAAYAPVLSDLGRYWQVEWLPQIESARRFWSAFDLEAATDAELAEHLADSLVRIQRIWEIHFELVFAVAHAWDMYYETYAEIFEGASRLDAMVLLEGIDNLTAEAGRGVWQLRELAAAVPAVAAVITTSEPSEVLSRLRDTPGANTLLDELDDYLETYGRRVTSFSLSSKTFLEDPAPVLSQVKDALEHPEADPRLHRDELNARREAAVSESRAALEHYPVQVREEFERRLAQAQVAVRLKEDHNFLIDYQCTALLRAVILEAAKRLSAAGVIEQPEDVQHLGLDELQASVNAVASGNVDPAAMDRRDLVTERSAEMQRFAGVEVPATIGTRPPGPPPSGAEESEPEPGTLIGVGMSAGVATGRVRVARTFDDAGALQPGEVLVATSTSQPWTPLFATAAALITEAGGVLSHMGVIAREYRLPAVAGIKRATTVLRDGMLVEVDGLNGTIRVLQEG